VRTHTNDDFNVLLGRNRISENMATFQNEDNNNFVLDSIDQDNTA